MGCGHIRLSLAGHGIGLRLRGIQLSQRASQFGRIALVAPQWNPHSKPDRCLRAGPRSSALARDAQAQLHRVASVGFCERQAGARALDLRHGGLQGRVFVLHDGGRGLCCCVGQWFIQVRLLRLARQRPPLAQCAHQRRIVLRQLPLSQLHAGMRLQGVHAGGFTGFDAALNILGQRASLQVLARSALAFSPGPCHLGCSVTNFTGQPEPLGAQLPFQRTSVRRHLMLGCPPHTGVPQRHGHFGFVFPQARVAAQCIGAVGPTHGRRTRSESLRRKCACLQFSPAVASGA